MEDQFGSIYLTVSFCTPRMHSNVPKTEFDIKAYLSQIFLKIITQGGVPEIKDIFEDIVATGLWT
jgi:hypothetical protein